MLEYGFRWMGIGIDGAISICLLFTNFHEWLRIRNQEK